MILEYLRPKTMQEALAFLSRLHPKTIPMGGGTVISRRTTEPIAVVDLQELGLNTIRQEGSFVNFGAACSLQQVLEAAESPEAIKKAILRETSLNLREMATLGGTVVAGPGYSPILAAFLALDALLIWEPEGRQVSLGDWLPLRKNKQSGLIREIQINTNAEVVVEAIGRSPADRSFLTVAAARWKSGRVRLVLGGNEEAPIVLMDGDGSTLTVGDIETAIENAHSHLINPWFSLDYQKQNAKTLFVRILGIG